MWQNWSKKYLEKHSVITGNVIVCDKLTAIKTSKYTRQDLNTCLPKKKTPRPLLLPGEIILSQTVVKIRPLGLNTIYWVISTTETSYYIDSTREQATSILSTYSLLCLLETPFSIFLLKTNFRSSEYDLSHREIIQWEPTRKNSLMTVMLG